MNVIRLNGARFDTDCVAHDTVGMAIRTFDGSQNTQKIEANGMRCVSRFVCRFRSPEIFNKEFLRGELSASRKYG
jgi:hypothetical protein